MSDETPPTRKQVVAALFERGRLAGKPVYFLDGPRPTPAARKNGIPDAAVYACIEGDKWWTVLPEK